MIYIQRKSSILETVDEFQTRKEATKRTNPHNVWTLNNFIGA